MIAAACSDRQFMELTDKLMGVDEAPTKLAKDRREHAAAEVRGIWHGNGRTVDSVRNTAWGGYQAIVEYIDHSMPVRGKPHEKAVNRAKRTVTSSNIHTLKTTAFAAFAELVPA